MKKEKIIGILGGMGPEATIELMHRIVLNTPAQDDSDHIRCIVDQNSKIPSRVKTLHGQGPSSGPELADMAKRLQNYGVDILCMPCNTAHYFSDYILQATSLPFIDMIETTINHIQKIFPNSKNIGILCASGARKVKIFEERLAQKNLQTIFPQALAQEKLYKIISSVKTGNISNEIKEDLQNIIQSLREQNVDLILLACTELSVITQKSPDIIDTMDCLVSELIRQVKQ